MFIFAAVQHDCAVFLAVRVNQAMFFCLHWSTLIRNNCQSRLTPLRGFWAALCSHDTHTTGCSENTKQH